MATSATSQARAAQKLHGLVAEFDNVDDLLEACEQIRDQGYTRWDSHTPFPVHGVDQAMGIRSTVLPWIVLVAGVIGLLTGLLMQWWTNAIDYPLVISGKPFFSLPANIPVIFELTVLFSALAAFFSVLGLNLLPQLYHPLFTHRRFLRVTDDRFFLAIDAADPLFEREQTQALLAAQNTSSPVEEVFGEARPGRLPRPLIYGTLVLGVISLIPLAFVLKARFSVSDKPQVHIVWDMDWQDKYKTQTASSFFADGRAMRPPVPGTVAQGNLIEPEDLPFHTGKDSDGQFLTGFPLERSALNEEFVARGRERFDIFCAPCHGLDGSGRGPVAVRALQLKEPGFVSPPSYHIDNLRNQPVGQLFDAITSGVRTMPSYAAQIRPADRWAIILYIRALQRSQYGTLEDVPPTEREALQDS